MLLLGPSSPKWQPPVCLHVGIAAARSPPAVLQGMQGEVLADGSDARDVALWQSKREAEAELRAAEEAARRGERVRWKRSAKACRV